MQAGKLRKRVVIEKPTRVKSASGAVTTTWSEHKTVWAGIETLKGYEKQSASASWPGSDSKICLRYVQGLLPTMRIVFEDKIYSILAITDIEERHREMELICQQGVKAS